MIVFVVALFSGCNQNVGLTGKVTFSDDNSPLTVGEVCFVNDKFLARGVLQKDGTYKTGSRKENDGIPCGEYQVYLAGTYKDHGIINQNHRDQTNLIELLVDEKYNDPKTSGLAVDVKKRTVFDFQVDRYVPKKKK
jgi:hypothetical protein